MSKYDVPIVIFLFIIMANGAESVICVRCSSDGLNPDTCPKGKDKSCVGYACVKRFIQLPFGSIIQRGCATESAETRSPAEAGQARRHDGCRHTFRNEWKPGAVGIDTLPPPAQSSGQFFDLNGVPTIECVCQTEWCNFALRRSLSLVLTLPLLLLALRNN